MHRQLLVRVVPCIGAGSRRLRLGTGSGESEEVEGRGSNVNASGWAAFVRFAHLVRVKGALPRMVCEEGGRRFVCAARGR